MDIFRIILLICGVRSSAFCGIHIIYSGAVIRGDRQGLFYGKFEASRCGTHLLYAGSPIAEVRHRRIILKTTRTVTAVRLSFTILRIKMNKQHFISILLSTCAAFLCLGAPGCSFLKHSHSWKNGYTYNEQEHWLECENCDEKSSVSAHVFHSPSCETCGFSHTPTEGVIYELSKDGSYASLVEYNGVETNVFLASSYNGVPVKEIAEYAFSDGNKLTNIIIPDSVQTIGRFAFEGCFNLTKLTIPSSVTTMGENIFLNCNNLTELTLPFIGANISEEANSHIGYFFGCDSESHQTNVPISLKKVTLTSATFIGDYAFRYCTSLEEVIIPRTVTYIGYGAFYACDSLTSIFIPSSVTMIKNYTFAYCYDITIYCELEHQPTDWDPRWNYDFPVVWGSKEQP